LDSFVSFKKIGVAINNYLKNLYENASDATEVMGVKMKPVLKQMLSHPWFDVETTGDNIKLKNDFAFGGQPYFVFISPEGKIIVRDFHSAFHKAKSTLEAEFGE